MVAFVLPSKMHNAPWLTSPNHALAPEMSLGVGKFETDSRNFELGLTFVVVTVRPANSTESCANWNFLGLRVIPLRAHRSSH